MDQKHYLSQREAERRRRGRTNVASPGLQGESWFGYQTYRNEASRSGVLAGENGPKKNTVKDENMFCGLHRLRESGFGDTEVIIL